MKKVSLFKAILAAVLGLSLLAGCTGGGGGGGGTAPPATPESESPEEETVTRYRIGFTVYGMDDMFTTFVVDGAQMFASEFSDEVDLHIGDSRMDSATQISLVENWVAQGFDAIIIYVVDSTTGPTLIDIATRGGVPIIGCNRAFDGMEDGIVAYVGSDETQAGTMQAEYIAEQLGGSGNVAILMGTLGLDNVAQRTGGNKSVFDRYSDINIVVEQTANWDRAQAMSVVENWLQMDLNLDAIVANNDEMALGASNALIAAGVKADILVSGIDATPHALEAISEGRLDASTFQPGMMQGYKAVEIALLAAKGQGPASFEAIWIDFELVTPDLVDQFLAMY